MFYVRFNKNKGRTKDECAELTDELVRKMNKRIAECEHLLILQDDIVYYTKARYYALVTDQIYDYDTGIWYYNLEIQFSGNKSTRIENVPFTDVRAITEDYEVLK